MSIVRLLITLTAMLFAVNVNALSSEAAEGKLLYPACHVCHNPAMDPPLGPPMWGVQRRYKMNSLDDEDFVKIMVDFVKTPTLETAIHDEALAQLGLMPAMPLPDAILKKIALYILEEKFTPPCDHWRITLKRSQTNGDMEHAKRDEKKLQRFCN